VDARKILFFPSWADQVFATPAKPTNLLQDLPPGRRIMFAGNIGAAQDFPAVIDAAEILKGRPDLQWIIVGDGRMASWARAEVARRGLHNIHFWGSHPIESMPAILSAADILLVSLRADPVFERTIPGKIQAYLASGRAIIGMLKGAGASVIDESGAGLTCAPGDPQGLAEAAVRMADMSVQQIAALGRAGRAYYERHFERDMLFDRLEAWMKGRDLPDMHDSRPTLMQE
jgi:glycosyltransferase involved in cell wall biosynthesis